MQILISLLIVAGLVLLAVVLVQLRNAERKIDDVAEAVRSGGAKTLVASIDKISAGIGKNEVERYLGRADNPTGKEWFYYIDENSGYLIRFDTRDRVEFVEFLEELERVPIRWTRIRHCENS